MPRTRKKATEPYREYLFNICGRPGGLAVEVTPDQIVQVGLTLSLKSECEALTTNMVDVEIESDQGRPMNCIFRLPDGLLPTLVLSQGRSAASVYKFQSVRPGESPAVARIALGTELFVIDLAGDQYRVKPPRSPDPSFPAKAAADYDARLAAGKVDFGARIDDGS